MGQGTPPPVRKSEEMNKGSGAETAEDREEALHASLVVVTKLDIVAKETHLTQTRASRNHLEAADEILAIALDRGTEDLETIARGKNLLEFIASQKITPAEPDTNQLRAELGQDGVEEEVLAVEVGPALHMEFLDLTSLFQKALPKFNRVVVAGSRLAGRGQLGAERESHQDQLRIDSSHVEKLKILRRMLQNGGGVNVGAVSKVDRDQARVMQDERLE